MKTLNFYIFSFLIFFNVGSIFAQATDSLKLGNLYKEALMHIQSGNYQKALDKLDQGIKIHPELFSLYYQKGIVYEKMGDYKQAISYFDKCYEYNSYPNLFLHRGRCFLKLNKKEEALADFKFLSDTEPRKYSFAFFEIGKLMFEDKKYDDALLYMNNFLEFNSNDIKGLYYRALAYNEIKDYDKSLIDLHKLEKLRGGLYPVYSLMYRTYLNLGDMQKALNYLSICVSLDPKNPELLRIRANVFERLGDNFQAKYDRERAELLPQVNVSNGTVVEYSNQLRFD